MGRNAVAIPGDIRDEAFCQSMVETAVQKLGGLNILVSNAARQQAHQSILDISTEQFDWTIKTKPRRTDLRVERKVATLWLNLRAVPN